MTGRQEKHPVNEITTPSEEKVSQCDCDFYYDYMDIGVTILTLE